MSLSCLGPLEKVTFFMGHCVDKGFVSSFSFRRNCLCNCMTSWNFMHEVKVKYMQSILTYVAIFSFCTFETLTNWQICKVMSGVCTMCTMDIHTKSMTWAGHEKVNVDSSLSIDKCLSLLSCLTTTIWKSKFFLDNYREFLDYLTQLSIKVPYKGI